MKPFALEFLDDMFGEFFSKIPSSDGIDILNEDWKGTTDAENQQIESYMKSIDKDAQYLDDDSNKDTMSEDDYLRYNTSVPVTPFFSIMYRLKENIDLNRDSYLVEAHNTYCSNFSNIMNHEVIDTHLGLGAVVLWSGTTMEEIDLTKEEINTFVRNDPLTLENAVENWEILDIYPGAPGIDDNDTSDGIGDEEEMFIDENMFDDPSTEDTLEDMMSKTMHPNREKSPPANIKWDEFVSSPLGDINNKDDEFF